MLASKTTQAITAATTIRALIPRTLFPMSLCREEGELVVLGPTSDRPHPGQKTEQCDLEALRIDRNIGFP